MVKTVGLSEEAYELLNEYRVKGKSFSDAVIDVLTGVCALKIVKFLKPKKPVNDEDGTSETGDL